MNRYGVATVGGYITADGGRHGSLPGLSAHVIDRLYLCQVVKTFRSEDFGGGRGGRRGIVGALRAAEEYAAELNRAEQEADRAA